jgi:hypothetical protein
MTATPDGHRRPVSQLSTRELDLYGNQLERCLKALSTGAPIRADVQRELAANLALVRPDSPARAPILAHISAIDTELVRRTGQQP